MHTTFSIPTPMVFFTIAVSVVSYLLMGWDKLCAMRGWWRLRERTLLGWAFLGGAIGAKIGQLAFRHKTRKHPFARNLNLAVALNVVAFAGLALPGLLRAVSSFLSTSG